ncbi:MAG: ATP-binding protein, partial [Dongiaceae bacterium]
MVVLKLAKLTGARSLFSSRNSLTFRLVVGASLWCSVALLAAYLVLTALFDLHLRQGLDADLIDRVDDLAAKLQVAPNGTIALAREPDLPKYDRQLSGHYWQIEVDGQPPLRSQSLWDARLPSAAGSVQLGRVNLRDIRGPRSERLRLAQRSLEFRDSARPITFSVAADLGPLLAAAKQFSRILAVSLGVLGVGLVSAVVLQVRIGLRPLERIKLGLAAIRAGTMRRLPDDTPIEIAPLTHELNALLDHHHNLIDRARAQAGDLAHALKTPLAVLRNELESSEVPDRSIALAKIVAMTDAVQHHLARARAAGSASVLGVRADAAFAIDALARTLPHMSADRELAVEVDVAMRPLWFAGEAQDLSEILGNLLENACKWAAGVVRISARRVGERLLIEIGDDGPGIAPLQRGTALQ